MARDSTELDRVLDCPPDLIGFNTYVWNITQTIKFVRQVKQLSPSTTVVLGGMEATYTASTILSDVEEVDIVVIGEGEIVFADLLERIVRDEPLSDMVPGLAYRDSELNVVDGGKGSVIANLDEIPSPFQGPDFQTSNTKDILFESYRGCAFSCDYCLYHRGYAPLRRYSDERVAADLKAIREAGCTHIRVVDSTFNINRRRTKEILRHLEGIEADVSVEVSAEFFDAETIDMLPSAGIRHIDIGLQSTNRTALESINRKWYKELPFKQNLRLLRDNPELTVNVELIAGLPGDDYAGLKKSINEVVLQWPDHLSVYRLLGLKGSEIDNRKNESGIRFSSDPPYEILESPGFSTAEFEDIELLIFSHLVLFNLGISRYALRYVIRITDKLPTDLYEEFWRYCVDSRLYDLAEIKELSQFYAYGNRFDRDLPGGLDPHRIATATSGFLHHIGANPRIVDLDNVLADELIDYGYGLAVLDRIEASVRSMSPARDDDFVQSAPWCTRKQFSRDLLHELVRQESDLGAMDVDDVSEVVFFVHPDLGPATLAVDAATVALMNELNRTPLNLTDEKIPAEVVDTINKLVDLRVLIPASSVTASDHITSFPVFARPRA